jgi:hypothetical protein
VKLTFNDYPEEAGNYGIYNQKNFWKTLVLTTTEQKVILAQSMKTTF